MANIYDMTDTWNDGATVFTSIKMNVTDTASASGSKLIDLQVGSSSKFSADNSGAVTFNSAFTFPTTDGTSGQTLSTNGSGTVTWSDVSVFWGDGSSTITTSPSASGSRAISLGNSSTATGSDSLAFGTSSSTSNTRTIAIGHSSSATSTNAVAIGYSSKALAESAVGIGQSAGAKTGIRSTAIGYGAMFAGTQQSGSVHINGSTLGNVTTSSEADQIVIQTDNARIEYTTADGFEFTADLGGTPSVAQVSPDAGVYVFPNLPTSDPTNAGQLWNDAGTLKVSAG